MHNCIMNGEFFPIFVMTEAPSLVDAITLLISMPNSSNLFTRRLYILSLVADPSIGESHRQMVSFLEIWAFTFKYLLVLEDHSSIEIAIKSLLFNLSI